ncbi:replication restart helicase PriA [Haploplasma axanthum]|uniref:Replication restart protein PriA n=1 Tax=Haploplasma axanthum TaxID=29552 RepID=A0A449BDI2_HAPAX|nr:primosomal protein N' [Haploplasma axanthum]VEU80506.1 Primosomal protein N' [Haploplasma axanthum]
MIARVLVDLKVKTLNRLFDYYIPESEKDSIELGMRVVVPFGQQKRLGYIIEFVEESDFADKTIIEVLDVVPSISKEAFEYLDYLKSKNNRLLIEIVETIIPSELFLKYEQYIYINSLEEVSKELLNEFKNGKVKYTNKLKKYKKEINRLIKNDQLKVVTQYEEKAKTKYKQVIKYLDDSHYKNAIKYQDLIEHVKEYPNLTRQELLNSGFSISSINTLIKNQVFDVVLEVDNRDVTFRETNLISEYELNNEQKKAYEMIKQDSKNIYLLRGITGSGKTEVYMHVMKDILKKGMQVLYLVPEIMLVAPLMQQLSSRFNERIVHYNSNLSQGERFDAWNAIINDEARIIVGTRSSVFLPIKNLGLIVVDEEHDNSYTQREKVQYETIDIVKLKSELHNCPVILGSATPKITSMYYALNNKYKLLELNKRATNEKLPTVHYVDMKNELKNGNTKIFSKLLEEKINEKLNKKEQIILLYNRKGYSSFVMCRTCGYTPKCQNCDVALTYYKDENELRCPYCNHKEEMPEVCPSCGNKTIRPIGMGIDQIYEIVRKHFENARVVKMDAKSTSRKGSHESIWLDFKDYQYDILVGTQMVSKGLDFPKVSLVGVLMADLELRAPTYLAAEETYSLLTQMVGRSGRKITGEAIIQGYDIANYAISSVDKSYNNFYEEAIYYRKLSKYLPFYEVVQLLISNESYLEAYQDALRIKKELEKEFEIVLGPAESLIKFIKNEFRFVITVKDQKIDNKIIIKVIEKYSKSRVNYLSIPDIL